MEVEPESGQFVSITVGGQMFGIPVMQVHDVLGPQSITRIPLAPPEIAGSLNLRGRIVTAVHVRRRLGLEPLPAGQETMSVVVEHHGDLYSLIVDAVGEVLMLDFDRFEPHPPTMPLRVREISVGIYQLKAALLIILDVSNLLDFIGQEPA
ncbi:MAG: chemotaxis protein CheW [Thalassobaculaceae bacterium]|nr:chemotaxis protein CheW [Thalassobaculaceae bacterium]